MIEIILKRLSKSKQIDQIILATSVDSKNKNLIKYVEGLGFLCIAGSGDVLERYIHAAQECEAEVIVELQVIVL